jgi:protein-disulfide isomerase
MREVKRLTRWTDPAWLQLPLAVMSLSCFSLQSHPEQVDVTNNELHALMDEVRELKVQQGKILEGMEEIKQLVLTANHGSTFADLPSVTEVSGELFRGEPSATVVIIEYGDFECVFCRRFANDTYPQIRDAYIRTGRVRFYFRDLPLEIHPFAMSSALSTRCAIEQGKFWQMHDELLRGEVHLTADDIDRHAKTIGLDVRKLKACMASGRHADTIRSSVQSAGKMGVKGTPTFFIGSLDPNGTTVTVRKALRGSQPFDDFKAALDPLLGTPSASASPAEGKTTIERR